MNQFKDQKLTSFGIAVRQRRLALGLSQEDLAHVSELDRTYIGGVERGERNVSLLNIWKIATALKAPPASFFAEASE